MSKSNKIRHIVRIQQMLKRWRRKARLAASTRAPSDVPPGHVAVCVGENLKRFVVRAVYLNHPIFKSLLVQAEEEYGFGHVGPLAIPCEEVVFEEIVRIVSSRSYSGSSGRFLNVDETHRCCHVGMGYNNTRFLGETRPLLH